MHALITVMLWHATCRYVLMPVNEPTFNTPRKSQIQTYLEQVCTVCWLMHARRPPLLLLLLLRPLLR